MLEREREREREREGRTECIPSRGAGGGPARWAEKGGWVGEEIYGRGKERDGERSFRRKITKILGSDYL